MNSDSKGAVDGNHTERIWQWDLLCIALRERIWASLPYHHYHHRSLTGISLSKGSNATLLASSRAFAEVFKEVVIAAESSRRLAESDFSNSSPEKTQNVLESTLSLMDYEADKLARGVSNALVDST